MIMLTGANGFIGKNLIKKLLEDYGENNVLAFTSKPIQKGKYILHNNYETLDSQDFQKVTTLIHLGSFTPKNRGEENNLKSAFSNINNTLKLLSINFKALKNIIYISTTDLYENDKIITEDSKILPKSVYAFSKIYSESLISSYAKKNNYDFQILRLGSVYGPGEEAYQKVIPMSLNRMLKGNDLVIHGNGNESRCFIYVDDVVKVILESLKFVYPNTVLNVVNNDKIKIKELMKLICSFSKKNINIIEKPLSSSQSAYDLIFCNRKMKNFFNISMTDLRVGLKKEIDYMISTGVR